MTHNATMLTPARQRSINKYEQRLAGPMFVLSLLFLVLLALLFHCYDWADLTGLGTQIVLGCLAVLWGIFVVEAIARFIIVGLRTGFWKPLGHTLLICLIPPLRMGACSHDNRLWLPRLGWQQVNTRLRNRLDRAFSLPMLIIALLIVPLLIVEYFWSEQLEHYPTLVSALDLAGALIWLAFAIEFILLVAVAEKKLLHCIYHWVDLAIVLLPMIEALPALRLLRLGRLARLGRVQRMSRLYRLRGLANRAWRGVLLLRIVERLFGRSLEKQLQRRQELLRQKEEELSQLREEIEQLEEQIAQQNQDRPSPDSWSDQVDQHATSSSERR